MRGQDCAEDAAKHLHLTGDVLTGVV